MRKEGLKQLIGCWLQVEMKRGKMNSSHLIVLSQRLYQGMTFKQIAQKQNAQEIAIRRLFNAAIRSVKLKSGSQIADLFQIISSEMDQGKKIELHPISCG